ncbi:hypothetical protein AB0F91_39655 [Amycolatopsis sp. NPDC023774]|uniref:hypothetical protein n=1 Tax=Amycolatopsis sp. NPDC023774 TaxID=3155015 RepID=UPI0033EC0508
MQNPAHGRGRSLDKAGWVALARAAMENTFEERLVMPHAEMEARLWEHGWVPPADVRPLRFFPHILTEAQQEMERENRISRTVHTTKGETSVDLLVTANTRLRKTAIAAASRRKGMLYGRYDRWSSTFGDAGEAVLSHSLTMAMGRGDGFTPVNSDGKFGELIRIAGLRFPGAVDNAAWLTVFDPATRIPLPHHLVLIEMKNRRLTLYPRHPEVYQLLHKAALASEHLPDVPIVPTLICRRGHPWLFWMAKDLGFRVQETRRQFFTLPDKTEKRYLAEVQDELALDLTPINGDMPNIIEFFKGVLPKQAAAAAARWKIMAPTVLDYAAQLRKNTLDDPTRTQLVAELHIEVDAILTTHRLGEPATWALPPIETVEDPTYI